MVDIFHLRTEQIICLRVERVGQHLAFFLPRSRELLSAVGVSAGVKVALLPGAKHTRDGSLRFSKSSRLLGLICCAAFRDRRTGQTLNGRHYETLSGVVEPAYE